MFLQCYSVSRSLSQDSETVLPGKGCSTSGSFLSPEFPWGPGPAIHSPVDSTITFRQESLKEIPRFLVIFSREGRGESPSPWLLSTYLLPSPAAGPALHRLLALSLLTVPNKAYLSRMALVLLLPPLEAFKNSLVCSLAWLWFPQGR